MGRIEHNVIEKQTCYPKALTQEVLDRLNDQIVQKKQKLTTVFEVEELKGEERLLGQLLNNLVENAIRYCPAEGQIQIRWQKSRSGTLLTVKDNGNGIPEEHHDRLFDRFYRVDKSEVPRRGWNRTGAFSS